MKYLLQYASLDSVFARVACVLAHMPAILVVLVLHAVEGLVRALHEVLVQLLVASGGAVQSFTNHMVSGSVAICRDTMKVVKGSTAS